MMLQYGTSAALKLDLDACNIYFNIIYMYTIPSSLQLYHVIFNYQT